MHRDLLLSHVRRSAPRTSSPALLSSLPSSLLPLSSVHALPHASSASPGRQRRGRGQETRINYDTVTSSRPFTPAALLAEELCLGNGSPFCFLFCVFSRFIFKVSRYGCSVSDSWLWFSSFLLFSLGPDCL